MSFVRRAVLAITSQSHFPINLRRRLALSAIALDGRPFIVDIEGAAYSGHLDNFIELMVYATRDYFEYTYINLVKSLVHGGCALDVGANVGNHSHAFSRFFDEVHAFEPYPPVADKLESKRLQMATVKLHRLALSDQEGCLRFSPPTSINLGVGRIEASGSLEVPVVVGDSYLEHRLRHPLNFVKIDVEGHELQVLAGLRGTLATSRPVVLFEVPKSLPGDWRDNLKTAFDCFPDRYRFVGLRTQSSFPKQRRIARGVPIDHYKPTVAGKVAYLLAYGEERGFRVEGDRILPPPKV